MKPTNSLIGYTIEVCLTDKNQPPQKFFFQKPEINIGRIPGRDIVLPKGNVSMSHCRLYLIENVLMVRDLKSTNGTYVNRKKLISAKVLSPEDEITIGDFVLQGKLTGVTSPEPKMLQAIEEEALAPGTDLVSLANREPLAWQWIALRLDAPSSLLLWIAQQCGPKTAKNLATNPSLPIDAVRFLLWNYDGLALFENPAFPLWSLEDPSLSALEGCLSQLLAQPGAPSEFFARYTSHPSPIIRSILVEHPKTPPPILMQVPFLDLAPLPRERVLRELVRRSPERLEKILQSGSKEERIALASLRWVLHKPAVLSRLQQDPDEEVRAALARLTPEPTESS